MIYFVRHGQTYDNETKTIQGNGPLNPNGINQAQQAAIELKDIEFDICFCSPLLRTKQTLEHILIYHPNLKVIYDDRLIERQYGDAVGMHYNEIVDIEKRWYGNINLSHNIESVDKLYSRVESFYNDLKKNYQDQNILIVSHSGVGRVSKGYFYGKPINDDYTDVQYKTNNGEVVIFSFDRY